MLASKANNGHDEPTWEASRQAKTRANDEPIAIVIRNQGQEVVISSEVVASKGAKRMGWMEIANDGHGRAYYGRGTVHTSLRTSQRNDPCLLAYLPECLAVGSGKWGEQRERGIRR